MIEVLPPPTKSSYKMIIIKSLTQMDLSIDLYETQGTEAFNNTKGMQPTKSIPVEKTTGKKNDLISSTVRLKRKRGGRSLD